nr:putative aminopeptidase W07G4.4 [Onthophagus taurus]
MAPATFFKAIQTFSKYLQYFFYDSLAAIGWLHIKCIPPTTRRAKDFIKQETAIQKLSEFSRITTITMEQLKRNYPFEVVEEYQLTTSGYDCVLLVNANGQETKIESFTGVLSECLTVDPLAEKEIRILPLKENPGSRLIHAPTGTIDPDYDDVRSLRETAVKGVQTALKAGFKKLLIALQTHPDFEDAELVTLLGVFEGLYVPLQIKELNPKKLPTIEKLGIWTDNKDKTTSVLRQALILESGLKIARDIGSGDPERMAPPKVQEYVESAFKNSSIKLDVIDDISVISKEYPLFEAVNRAASVVERHRGRIIYMEYNPQDQSKIIETIMLVGKGVTYDTGGADIKAGGIMAGMSRDKCGAAAVAGFMQVVNLLKPENVKVIGALSLVRNSVGSNCYVADELIKARSGALVRVGNTDAEGRMVMADVLCKMKELAMDAVNPSLFTIATLTGHAFLTVGTGYSIVMDNGPAKRAGTSTRLQTAGEKYSDPFEVSTIRREDLAFHRGKAQGDDVMQCSNAASSRTARGHQGPAGFLILASGLDKHGSGNQKPIKYSHLDIAGSAGDFPNPATGAPILALSKAFLFS